MIVKKRAHIGSKYYDYIYSDEGFYIEREGVKYIDVYDPYGSNREYTETQEKIDDGTMEVTDSKDE